MTSISVRVVEKNIPTYTWADYEELPMFAKNRIHQRLSGDPYPNRVVNKVRRDELKDRSYAVIELENEFIKLEIIPELGGRIFSALDKKTGYYFFYRQHVIKPALIGMMGLWISGGLEFNWPVHHNPATFFPVESQIEKQSNGIVTVWLGSRDLIDRLEGQIGIRMYPGRAYFETSMKITNTNPIPKSFMWWENAAVPVHEGYEVFFPHDVSYVDFHYKKTRGSFPVMGSYFNTADNRGGNDIRKHKNTTSATSYFCGLTKGDFFGGWDNREKAGVIHYAPHQTSTGAKMFTWGYGQIGRAWEKTLTDTDGPYAELMASSYSDNQPDLTWLEPFETKEFSQYWYPYSSIGTVDCANLNMAVRLTEEKLLVYPTFTIKQAVIEAEGTMITTDLTAAESMEIAIPGLTEESRITVYDNNKEVIFDYERSENNHEVPDPIEDYPYPDEIGNSQECYLTGLHVAQYRDPKITCEPYYKKGLQLQKDSWPCMAGLARFYIERLNYTEAERYAREAVTVLTRYNENPRETEVYTLLGLALKEQDRFDEAYEYLKKAVWNRSQITTAGLLIAQIDCIRGDYKKAEKNLLWLLKYSGNNHVAENLLVIVYKKLGKTEACRRQLEKCLQQDHFDIMALNEKGILDLNRWQNGSLQTAIDLASEYADAGLFPEAVKVLESIDCKSPMIPVLISYFKGTILNKEGLKAESYFPSRKWELHALRKALETDPDNDLLNLLLGDLIYGKCDNTGEALACFRKAGLSLEARRNLAVVIYRTDNSDPESLEIMEALAHSNPDNLQILYEYQLLGFLKNIDPAEMLKFWEAHKQNMIKRDDIYLQGVCAANLASKHEYALKLLEEYEFTPCEGGEHAVADEYLIAKLEIGKQHYNDQKYEEALEIFESALTIPTNLGGGVWHQVKLVAFWYHIGRCYRSLGKEEEATKNLEQAASFPIEYFTDQYNLSHRYFKGKALIELGKEDEGQKIIEAYKAFIDKAMKQKDYGYFAPTPFFDSFVESPEQARKRCYKRLRDLSMH